MAGFRDVPPTVAARPVRRQARAAPIGQLPAPSQPAMQTRSQVRELSNLGLALGSVPQGWTMEMQTHLERLLHSYGNRLHDVIGAFSNEFPDIMTERGGEVRAYLDTLAESRAIVAHPTSLDTLGVSMEWRPEMTDFIRRVIPLVAMEDEDVSIEDVVKWFMDQYPDMRDQRDQVETRINGAVVATAAAGTTGIGGAQQPRSQPTLYLRPSLPAQAQPQAQSLQETVILANVQHAEARDGETCDRCRFKKSKVRAPLRLATSLAGGSLIRDSITEQIHAIFVLKTTHIVSMVEISKLNLNPGPKVGQVQSKGIIDNVNDADV